MSGRDIVILGGAGQLGRELRAALPGSIALDRAGCDVTEHDAALAALAPLRPRTIINAAAYTNVDAAEDDPAGAFAVNAAGALHVARVAEQLGARLLYISTDYVFGRQDGRLLPYVESDSPGPLNVYGASKLAGEELTLSYCRRAAVLRTCGIYGHAGARGKGGNFVETMLRLGAAGRPVRVVDDQRLSPTSAAACAAAIAEAAASDVVGRLHVAASDACTWYEFAREIFRFAGLDVDVQPIRTHEYPLRARRPAFSVLGSERLAAAGLSGCPPWREMLRVYIETRPQRPEQSSEPAAGHSR